MEKCSATGAVHGNGNIGGLIGLSNGRIVNSYALGSVTDAIAGSEIGGLIVRNTGTVEHSYWNLDAAQTIATTARADADKMGIDIQNSTVTGVISFIEAQLKMPTAPDTMIMSGTIYNGWSTMDWDFGTSSQFPSLRRFKFTDNNGNGIFDTGDVQVQSELLCGQPATHVQCLP